MRRFFDKALSIFLSFAFVCGMAGCSFRPAQETSDPDVYVIGFSQLGSESDWRIANTKSMNDTFANNPDYELVMDNARQQQENQFAAVVITFGILAALLCITIFNGYINSAAIRLVLDWFSIYNRFYNFTYGLFDFGALIYYLSVSGVFVFLTIRVFESRRYR
jgi:hypothetical protein